MLLPSAPSAREKIPREMRVSLRCPYGRMTYTGSNGRQNALSAVQPSPTAPIADDTIVLPIIPIPMKFVNIFLLFSLDSRKKSGYNGRRGASPLNPTRGFASGLQQGAALHPRRVFDPLDTLFAIELSASAYRFRVFIQETGKTCYG